MYQTGMDGFFLLCFGLVSLGYSARTVVHGNKKTIESRTEALEAQVTQLVLQQIELQQELLDLRSHLEQQANCCQISSTTQLPVSPVSITQPVGLDCRRTQLGQEYRGRRNMTALGLSCQRWDKQSPHSHSQEAKGFHEKSLSNAENYCRNPDSEPEGPWCYTVDPETRWQYCDIPLCPSADCRPTQLGLEYMGRINMTASGLSCQRWEEQSPHSHSQEAKGFPEKSLSQAENYCRNPDSHSGGPWCYTIDLNIRWQTCDIPLCPSVECLSSHLGLEYVGRRSKTASGLHCQRWDQQSPHSHSQGAERFPEKSLSQAENYCRNPDSHNAGPWCYTIDPNTRWQTCNIPLCPSVECLSSHLGLEYVGRRSKTASGLHCQRWDQQSPHSHSQRAERFPEKSLSQAENYCRNPDSHNAGPWCYTIDPNTRWQTCNIPLCPSVECLSSHLGLEYVGRRSKTASGLHCQRWDQQSPHSHSQSAERFPEKSLSQAENYCRNPDSHNAGPWCYTIDPNTRWQTCNIPLCPSVECLSSHLGLEYVGRRSKTASGLHCQRWDQQSPHSHSQRAERFPEKSLSQAENYCRNPDSHSGGPWCYTINPNTRWQICDIPVCP